MSDTTPPEEDDMTDAILAKSDQLNASDLIPGAIIVTISHVTVGTPEQPRNLHLVEYPDKAYRPSKGMTKVIVTGWGKSSKAYTGRRLKLFRNPTVKWAGKAKGGIEIESMSDIEDTFTLPIPLNKNEVKLHTVTPLPPERSWLQELEQAGGDLDASRALGYAAIAAKASSDVINAIRAAVAATQKASGK